MATIEKLRSNALHAEQISLSYLMNQQELLPAKNAIVFIMEGIMNSLI